MKKDKIKKICSVAAAGLLMGLFTYASVYSVVETKAQENDQITLATSQTENEGVIDVVDYNVEITVNNNYTVVVSEKMTVEFISETATSFYRTIPHVAEDVLAIEVTSEDNAELCYTVVETVGGVKVECFGGVALGNVWTYEIDYTVALRAKALTEEFVFNIIGGGWQNTAKNVVAKITVPDSIVSYDVCDGYGARVSNVSSSLSENGKTITVSSNQTEAVAASSNAIMVKIYLPDEETMEDFNIVSKEAKEKVWTPVMIVALVLGSVLAILCLVLI